MVTENQALPSLRRGLCAKFILAAFFTFSAPVPALPKPAASIAQMLGRTSLSRSCVEDFANLLETGYFDMASFAKELVPAAAKTRLKLKSPFGKPKDSEMTSAGLSVGCIRTLDEESRRNMSYGIGAGLLAGGLVITVFF